VMGLWVWEYANLEKNWKETGFVDVEWIDK
jgi:hypothetical protein